MLKTLLNRLSQRLKSSNKKSTYLLQDSPEQHSTAAKSIPKVLRSSGSYLLISPPAEEKPDLLSKLHAAAGCCKNTAQEAKKAKAHWYIQNNDQEYHLAQIEPDQGIEMYYKELKAGEDTAPTEAETK